MHIELRPATADDQAFLFSVYASTRAEEVQLTGWNAAQQDAFLHMQFNAQRSSYAMQFPKAEYSLIVQNGREAGRMIVDRSGEKLLLIDIALLPEFRGTGTGSELIKQLLEESTKSDKPVILHVETSNRALRLYERLGFTPIANNGLYVEMIWQPPTRVTSDQQRSA